MQGKFLICNMPKAPETEESKKASVAMREKFDEVVKLLNQQNGRFTYTHSHIVVSSTFMDYNDGLGQQLVSAAVVINPKDNLNDLLVDCVGTQDDALEGLLAVLRQSEKSGINIFPKMQEPVLSADSDAKQIDLKKLN